MGGRHLRSVAALGLGPPGDSRSLHTEQYTRLRTLRDISGGTTVADTATFSPPHVPITPYKSRVDLGVSSVQQTPAVPYLDSAMKNLSVQGSFKYIL